MKKTSYLETDLSDLVSQADKAKKPYLEANCDHAIATLVHEKENVIKAFNLYNGHRDPLEYEYLQKNYGIGMPMQLQFTPLLRGHFNALLGQQLTDPLRFKITCASTRAADYIRSEQADALLQNVIDSARTRLEALLKDPSEKQNAEAWEKYLAELQANSQETFRSQLEIEAQDLVTDYTHQDNFKLIANDQLRDLLVCGESYYRAYVQEAGHEPVYMYVHPQDLFYQPSPLSRQIKDAACVVHRQRYTRQQILNQYGYQLTKAQQESILAGKTAADLNYVSIHHGSKLDSAHLNSAAIQDTLMVYHVEWLANNRVEIDEDMNADLSVVESSQAKKITYRYRLDRYETTRIGEDIYVDSGPSRFVSREIDCPYKSALTYNGFCFQQWNNLPYSLILATKSLQDKYDLLDYFENNLVASSGTRGIRVHVPSIPTFLGTSPEERMMKHLAYLKQGVDLVDDTDNSNRPFAHYGEYNLSLDSSVGLLSQMKEQVKETMSSITGVNRQMLAAITNQDLVSTTERAITQSTLITKPIFTVHRELMQAALTDLLNCNRLAFPEGKQGMLPSGNGQRPYQVSASTFQLSDYRIHLTDGAVEQAHLETIRQLGFEFVKAQTISPELAIDFVTVESLTEISIKVKRALEQGNDQALQQAKQQISELEKQLKQLSTQVDAQAQAKLQVQAKDQQIRTSKVEGEQELQQQKLLQQKQYQQAVLQDKRERTKLEREQLLFPESSAEPRNNWYN